MSASDGRGREMAGADQLLVGSPQTCDLASLRDRAGEALHKGNRARINDPDRKGIVVNSRTVLLPHVGYLRRSLS
jgi:hypothetical protein